ncbi:hypothetical protein N431DRAFT_342931 [Stipitochalara longipes BDJ]|nr:hypothetical protein N431DRAFT_342931 [Stipitochalara longipes BDJ]
MEQSTRPGKLSMKDWEHLLGTNCGTGSGTRLDYDEIRRTGQVFTGCEMLEIFSALLGGKPFSLSFWLEGLNNDLQHGGLTLVEHPTRDNQSGKFQYEDGMRVIPFGWPSRFPKRTWFEDVLNGVDTALRGKCGMEGELRGFNCVIEVGVTPPYWHSFIVFLNTY